jgi:hypothetical protein
MENSFFLTLQSKPLFNNAVSSITTAAEMQDSVWGTRYQPQPMAGWNYLKEKITIIPK